VSRTPPIDPVIAWLPDALGARQPLLDARPLGRENSDVWLIDIGGWPGVLKRERPRLGGGAEDIVWEHTFLESLATHDFPASRPLPLFDGRSWCRSDGRRWGAFTYLPGRPLLWERWPDLAEAGAFLARYHEAARLIAVSVQRPTATPIGRLRDLMPRDRLPIATGSAANARRFDRLLEEMEDRLNPGGYFAMDEMIVHGDFTMDNVLIEGEPPRITGLIDFGSAYRERWPADLAFGLWRSGRAKPADVALDLDRVGRFVGGYHQREPIGAEVVLLLPVLLWARGLQLAARWVERAPAAALAELAPVTTMILRRIDWIRANERELSTAIRSALSE
jgi:Ser/Thr protein kinase RdoA (MazF antagonist)